MKLVDVIRALIATSVIAASAHATAAPILLVDSNGILTGARNVDVAGALYDVTISAGSCDTLFNGCDNASFTFRTLASSTAAAQALLDHVLVDSSSGLFDSDPNKISGCRTVATTCLVAIPFLYETDDDFRTAYTRGAINSRAGHPFGDRNLLAI